MTLDAVPVWDLAEGETAPWLTVDGEKAQVTVHGRAYHTADKPVKGSPTPTHDANGGAYTTAPSTTPSAGSIKTPVTYTSLAHTGSTTLPLFGLSATALAGGLTHDTLNNVNTT